MLINFVQHNTQTFDYRKVSSLYMINLVYKFNLVRSDKCFLAALFTSLHYFIKIFTLVNFAKHNSFFIIHNCFSLKVLCGKEGQFSVSLFTSVLYFIENFTLINFVKPNTWTFDSCKVSSLYMINLVYKFSLVRSDKCFLAALFTSMHYFIKNIYTRKFFIVKQFLQYS